MCVCTYVRVCIYVHVRACVYLYLHICMYVLYMCVYVRARVRIDTHTLKSQKQMQVKFIVIKAVTHSLQIDVQLYWLK